MNRITKIYLLIVVFLMLNVLSAETTTGMGFLNMPTSAKAAATMSVFASEHTNATNLFENPIGIMNETTNVNFSNNFWFADINQTVLTFGKNTKLGTLGMGLNFVNAPGFEVRSRPTDEPEGEVDAQFMAITMGMTRKLIRKVYVGVNAKYLYESMYTENAQGFAMDIAAMWKMPSNMNLTFAMQNIGFMSELDQESTELPTQMKFGIVRPKIMSDSSPINGALGIYFDQNLKAERTEIKVGGEISIYDKLMLRSGYSIEKEFNNASFGLGLNLNRIRFDFAMLMMDEIPNYPYVLTFSYDL